jgi:hypothetical protein
MRRPSKLLLNSAGECGFRRNKVKADLGCELPLETVRKVGYAFTADLQVDASR